MLLELRTGVFEEVGLYIGNDSMGGIVSQE